MPTFSACQLHATPSSLTRPRKVLSPYAHTWETPPRGQLGTLIVISGIDSARWVLSNGHAVLSSGLQAAHQAAPSLLNGPKIPPTMLIPAYLFFKDKYFLYSYLNKKAQNSLNLKTVSPQLNFSMNPLFRIF